MNKILTIIFCFSIGVGFSQQPVLRPSNGIVQKKDTVTSFKLPYFPTIKNARDKIKEPMDGMIIRVGKKEIWFYASPRWRKIKTKAIPNPK